MKLSPLDLCRYVVTDISCSANPEFDAGQTIEMTIDELTVETSIQKVDIESEDRIGWSIDLSLSYQVAPKENYPYNYSMQIVGFFSSPAAVPSGMDDERLVRVNGASMLYGIAREKLRSLSEAGPWDGVLIPTASFFEPKEQTEDK